MTPPEIFDRKARRLRRGRVRGGGFLVETMARNLVERLDCVNREFTTGLLMGAEPLLVDALTTRGIALSIADPSPRRAAIAHDEDTPHYGEACFDLIVACGTLDTVADLPGALSLMRRALVPDGLLLASFAGAPSLIILRKVVAAVDVASGVAIARMHPQIDVRAAGDLLVRAGFALPVADLDTLDIAYSNVARLFEDLRAAAATNVLPDRRAVTRRWCASVDARFNDLAGDDGRTHETLSYLTLTGWAPSPDQPKPARRGSGTTSLSEALRRAR